MTNKQAIAHIESIMSNYEVSKIKDWANPMYRQVTMWLSDKDIIALKLGIEALKEKDDEQQRILDVTRLWWLLSILVYSWNHFNYGDDEMMDLWELIAILCQKVVQEQNVFLDILITKDGWEFQLMPIGEYEDEEEEDD